MADCKANIAVFVSGGGTNLQALIDAEKAGIISSGSIKLVVSNIRSAYALERAANAGIRAEHVSKKLLGQEGFEAKVTELLEEEKIDLIVLAGFLCILSSDFTKRYENRIINIHPSLIPSFCGEGFYGLTVHEKALEYGVKVTGATVHFVNEIPDGGKIIAQKAVYIEEGDTPEILQKRVMEQAEWIILPQAAETVCRSIIEKRQES
ncbi:MAG: phosphoribosylglycinamide formyltransferase [Clostridia bacterium]|nr:phosphoribosylglycinamide formyltransferase [Clostridia bacterium]